MKRLLVILFLMNAIAGLGQVEKQFLAGHWKYVHTTNLRDSVIESSVRNFEMEIMVEGGFNLTSDTLNVLGTWTLGESTLILEGKRNGEEEVRTQKMQIYALSKSSLSVEFSTEDQHEALMIFSRIE